MHLDPPILTQVENPEITVDESARRRCQMAAKLAAASKYEEACQALGDLWQGLGVRPRLDGLSDGVSAEVLFRVGCISGWLGSVQQIEGVQEAAKNLISESVRSFETLGDIEKVAEAQIDLAICYLREGAFDEARITLRGVLGRLEHSQSEQKLRAFLNSAVVESSCGRDQTALQIHLQAAPFFDVSTNSALKGKFHNEFAVVLKKLGVDQRREEYIDRALVEYTAAAYHWEEAGDNRLCAISENNIGSLLISVGKVKDAHKHLNRARQLLLGLRDKVNVAHVDDTRARACLAEGRNAEAEKLARNCVRAVEGGDHQSVLADFLTTHALALSRVGRHQQASATFQRAMEIAEAAGHPEGAGEAAVCLIEELGTIAPPRVIYDAYSRAENLLSDSQSTALQSRLGRCARRTLALKFESPAPVKTPGRTEEFSGCSLDEEVLRYEADLIKQALEAADGSVTRAARLLKVTHQGLAFILQGRQKHLLAARTPVRKRRRSIMRAH